MEEIHFQSSSDGDDEDQDQQDGLASITAVASGNDEEEGAEGSFVLAGATTSDDATEMMGIELAILRERHDNITEIHHQMKHINEIQKGMYVWCMGRRGICFLFLFFGWLFIKSCFCNLTFPNLVPRSFFLLLYHHIIRYRMGRERTRR